MAATSILVRTARGVPFRARTTNATDNGFPSRVKTRTKPSGTGNSVAQATASAVFDVGQGGLFVPNGLKVKLYGAGSNNNTLSARIIAWAHVIAGGNTDTDFWDPTVLVELAATLSSSCPGPANAFITTTDLFADTLTITGTTANAGVNINVVSPANDTDAYAVLDFTGCDLLEITFTTGGSATSCNALVAWI